MQYLQGNCQLESNYCTVRVPLKYLILMPDIQEAKCFKFTDQILPPQEPSLEITEYLRTKALNIL